MAKRTVKLKHKKTKKPLTIEVSENLQEDAEIKAHCQRTLPEFEVVEVVKDKGDESAPAGK